MRTTASSPRAFLGAPLALEDHVPVLAAGNALGVGSSRREPEDVAVAGRVLDDEGEVRGSEVQRLVGDDDSGGILEGSRSPPHSKSPLRTLVLPGEPMNFGPRPSDRS